MVGTAKKHRDLMLPPPDETYVGSSSASSSSSSSDHDDAARNAVEMTCLDSDNNNTTDDQEDTHLWNPPPSVPTALQEDDLEEETVQGSRTLYRHSLEDDDDDDDEWDDDEGGFAMSPPTNHGSRLYHPLGSRTGRTTCTTRIWQALSIVVLSLTVAVWYRFVGGPNSYPPAWMSSSSGSTSHYVATTKPSTHHHYAFTADEIRRMQQHLTPQPLHLDNTTGSVTRHQLLHLHHMKTGGTSLDALIRCGVKRWESLHHATTSTSTRIPYTSLHECGPQRYNECKEGTDQQCHAQMQRASVASFCAPLRDLSAFDWTTKTTTETPSHGSTTTTTTATPTTTTTTLPNPFWHAVTVLRDPVDRVWSMYRFKTKFCYACLSLAEVYAVIANGTYHEHFVKTMGPQYAPPYAHHCASQLQNHMTRNLLVRTPTLPGSTPTTNWTMEDYDALLWSNTTTTTTTAATNWTAAQLKEARSVLVQQAVEDLHSVFTIVGLTEELPLTRRMVGHVFPWLAQTLNVGTNGKNHTTTTTKQPPQQCVLPHANASPRNNRCGSDGISHWDLPPHPSAADAALIRQYNALDIQVYQAAQRQFALQRVALGWQQAQPQSSGQHQHQHPPPPPGHQP